MFSKIFNKYFQQSSSKTIQINFNQKEFIDWLLYDSGKTYFKLTPCEMNYLIQNYLIPWEGSQFDDSFLAWNSKTPYLELDYFIEAIKGVHGFKIAQSAFDYLHLTYAPLATHFQSED